MNKPVYGLGILASPVGRLWRVFWTGMSFLLFGLGGVVLGLLVFPLLPIIQRDNQRRVRWARRIIQFSFRRFIGFMRAMGVLTWSISGEQRLQRPGLLVLANHPTLLDVVFLGALVPDANCIVKRAVARNPFMRGPALAADFICNDEGPGLVADCIQSLESGSNLIIFPEGTRTPSGCEVGAFQRGAANIAVRGRRQVTPVLIRCMPPTLKKGQKWYSVPPCRMHFSIDVGCDIDLAPTRCDSAADAIFAREASQSLRDYFVKELLRADSGN